MIYTTKQTFPIGGLGEKRFMEKYPGVTDVRKSPIFQKRGIDFIWDSQWVDIKTDTHDSPNIALEVEVDGKPGCVFTSRAQVWVYIFLKTGKWFILDMPRLQQFVAMHYSEYPVRKVYSANKKQQWSASVLLVPKEILLKAGIARLHVATEELG